VPLGIWAARNRLVAQLVRPVLDFMQTMPAFVYLIPAVLFFRLGKVPGIVATVMSNLGLERFLNGLNLTLQRTKVGDRYVVEHMRAHGFNVGGEQSGHIVLSDFSTTGDGLLSALQVLACLKRQDKPASELLAKFEPVPQLLKNVRFAGGKPLESAPVKAAIEGARDRLGKNGRLVIRPSGTEPLIRVMAEADDRSQIERIVNDLVGVIANVRTAA